MSEQDYINVRDLSNVTHATEMLRQITIANQPNIHGEKFRATYKTLVKWRDALFDAVERGRGENEKRL